jgi:uncharacterized protein DUF669
MPVTVDLTDVPIGGPAPLEAGVYPAVITKSDIHASKNSGEDTLYLDLSVNGGEDEEGDPIERTAHWNTSLQKKSLGRFKQLLVRLGVDIPEGEFSFDEQDLVGVECNVRLTLEPHYRDPERQTNRVAEIFGTDEDGSWGS